jgi:DNA-binding protein H-NS
MKTYQSVREQIAKLEQQAEALRRQELKTVIAQVREVIAQYGLTASDLGLAGGRVAARAGKARRVRAGVGVAKYRDPKTGQTWTGRGRPPAWIAAAKDRDAFLIDAPAKKAPAAKQKPAAKKAATKKAATKKSVGRKGRARKTPAVEIESGVAVQ